MVVYDPDKAGASRLQGAGWAQKCDGGSLGREVESSQQRRRPRVHTQCRRDTAVPTTGCVVMSRVWSDTELLSDVLSWWEVLCSGELSGGE